MKKQVIIIGIVGLIILGWLVFLTWKVSILNKDVNAIGQFLTSDQFPQAVVSIINEAIKQAQQQK